MWKPKEIVTLGTVAELQREVKELREKVVELRGRDWSLAAFSVLDWDKPIHSVRYLQWKLDKLMDHLGVEMQTEPSKTSIVKKKRAR